MKIYVKAKTRARENKVVPPTQRLLLVEEERDYYVVHVKEPPVQNRANFAIVKLLAEHFKVSTFQVILVSGEISRRKIFEIKK